jgi:redox-sensitive bicupin YhaK (pirin superfamily)
VRYVGLQQESIPAIALPGGGELNLIAGEWQGSVGPIETLTSVFMSTLRLPAGAHEQLPVSPSRQVFLYVVDGDVTVGGESAKPHHLIELDLDGDSLVIEASSDARLLFGHGDVINEPMVSHGPFVMNTREEIAQAVEDYQNGKFGGLGA